MHSNILHLFVECCCFLFVKNNYIVISFFYDINKFIFY